MEVFCLSTESDLYLCEDIVISWVLGEILRFVFGNVDAFIGERFDTTGIIHNIHVRYIFCCFSRALKR